MKMIRWAVLLIGIALLTVRFFYGRENELSQDGKFALTNTGLTLSILTVIFLLTALIMFADKKKD